MKLLTIFIIALLIGAFFTVQIYNLDLNNPKDRETFIGKFWLWMKGTGKNVIDVTGYVVQKDWLPQNDTNKTKAQEMPKA